MWSKGFDGLDDRDQLLDLAIGQTGVVARDPEAHLRDVGNVLTSRDYLAERGIYEVAEKVSQLNLDRCALRCNAAYRGEHGLGGGMRLRHGGHGSRSSSLTGAHCQIVTTLRPDFHRG